MNQERQRPAKHVPLRTCVVCRDKESKRTLTRVVRTEQGVQVDPSGKMNGRGAYLCDRPACWERALSGEVLSRALRTTLTAEDRERLKQAKP
ncbi:MAG: YlxR family protein [Chloroflexi bacterium]|nr:YlxR family protein [Chloroflexota bacterium]